MYHLPVSKLNLKQYFLLKVKLPCPDTGASLHRLGSSYSPSLSLCSVSLFLLIPLAAQFQPV